MLRDDPLQGVHVIAPDGVDQLTGAREARPVRRAVTPRNHVLRIGESNGAFDVWCAAQGIETWAFVTAANPYSQSLSPEENAARDAALRTDPALRLLALNFAWQLAYFSLLFRAQIGYRFALTCIPLAWIVAAAGLLTPRAGRPSSAARRRTAPRSRCSARNRSSVTIRRGCSPRSAGRCWAERTECGSRPHPPVGVRP